VAGYLIGLMVARQASRIGGAASVTARAIIKSLIFLENTPGEIGRPNSCPNF